MSASVTTNDVHREYRSIAKQLVDEGLTLGPGSSRFWIQVTKNGVKVTSLPSSNSRKAYKVQEARLRRELEAHGVVLDSKKKRQKTNVERAFEDAAKQKGHRELTEAEMDRLKHVADPDAPDRGSRKPRDLGVLRPYEGRRRPTVTRSRYYGQREWSAFTISRLKRHRAEFATRREFVEFAIEVAKERELPAPGRSSSVTGPKAWDVDRILKLHENLMGRGSSSSLTLQFFNAALDELEGIGGGITRPAEAEPEPEVGVVVEATEQVHVEEVQEDLVAIVEEHFPSEASDERALKLRLANLLLTKLEQGDEVDEDLVDRITGLID
jgi:hypothetical protein